MLLSIFMSYKFSTSFASFRRSLIFGGKYFSAKDENGYGQIFISDGTFEGTYSLTSFKSTSWPTHLKVIDEKLFFIHNIGHFGNEMWSLDLTHPGSERPYDYSNLSNQDYGRMGVGHVDSASSSNLVASNTGYEFIAFSLLLISAIAIGIWAYLYRHWGVAFLQVFYATAGIIGMFRWY